MKVITFVCFSFCLFFSTTLSAQYTPQEQVDKEVIYLQTGFFSGLQYVENGVKYPTGSFYGKLIDKMEVNPNAAQLLKKARRNDLIATGIAIVGVLAFGEAINYADFENVNSGWLFTSVGLAVTSGIFKLKSGNQVNEAVWIYNEGL